MELDCIFWAFEQEQDQDNTDIADDAAKEANNNDNETDAPGTTSANNQTSSSSSRRNNNNSDNNNSNNNNSNDDSTSASAPRGILTEVEQRHMLRCVHFPPNGNTIIVGGVNPPSANENNGGRRSRGGISGGGMSFYLRLWNFDLRAAMRPGELQQHQPQTGLRRRAISNVSVLGVVFDDSFHSYSLSYLLVAAFSSAF